MITQETAQGMARAYREIETSSQLLVEVDAKIAKDAEAALLYQRQYEELKANITAWGDDTPRRECFAEICARHKVERREAGL